METNSLQIPAYTLIQPLTRIFPAPIVAKRAPTANDKNYPIGQMWIYATSNLAYILTSVVNNSATWSGASGSAAFSSLTVTPGPIDLEGTTTINTTSTAATTIGNSTNGLTVAAGGLTVTAGGLTVSAGGAAITGNSTVTGTLGATGVFTTASAVTPASTGSIVEVFGGGGSAPSFVVSGGAPTVTAGINKGSLAVNTAAVTASTRLYVFDGSAWQAFTAAG